MTIFIITAFVMGAVVGGILTVITIGWLGYLYDKMGDRHYIFAGKHWIRRRS